jgi:hypothetical protein
MTLLTLEHFVGFKGSIFDVGQGNNGGFKIDNVDLEPCPYQNLTSMHGSK